MWLLIHAYSMVLQQHDIDVQLSAANMQFHVTNANHSYAHL